MLVPASTFRKGSQATYRPTLILFPTHCYLRGNAFILQKTAIHFFLQPGTMWGKQTRRIVERLGREVATQKPGVIKILPKENGTNEVLVPQGTSLLVSPGIWLINYVSRRKKAFSLTPSRSQQTQNVTVNFHNLQQPQSGYLIQPWKYDEVPCPHIFNLKSKANTLK